MKPGHLLFIDTETTSLCKRTGRIYEVGAIRRTPGEPDAEYHWFLPLSDLDLERADLVALKIGRFEKRYDPARVTPLHVFRHEFKAIADGTHLVGAVPSFDEDRLERIYHRAGFPPPSWHYHLVDVEALVAGKLGIAPPWRSSELAELVGCDLDPSERHTALGDARMAKDMFDAVLGVA